MQIKLERRKRPARKGLLSEREHILYREGTHSTHTCAKRSTVRENLLYIIFRETTHSIERERTHSTVCRENTFYIHLREEVYCRST